MKKNCYNVSRGISMKKFFVFFTMLSLISVLTTACTNQIHQKSNMIQSKRRFAEYVEPQVQKDPNAIDLSEGPRQNYNAKFGPKNPEFDIKIVDPY